MSGDNYNPNDDPQRRPIDLGNVDVPDFSRRIPGLSEEYAPESHRRASEFDDYGDDDRNDGNNEQGGCLSLFSGKSSAWIFVLIMIVAAFRGQVDGQGCLPGRRCLNIIFGVFAGIGLFVGSFFVAAETEADGVATAMACAGGFICLGSVGGVALLLFSISRMIDINPWDNVDGGLLDNILGGFGGGGRN
jgi:hypothetical protein